MATRKPETVAAINRKIDAINAKGWKANPAKRGVSLFVATRSKNKALEHAASKGIDAGIAVKVNGGFVVYQAYDTNPARSATLVAKRSGNPGARNLAAPRKKPRENWPRFVVEEKEGVGPWMPRASFRILEDAEKLARDIHRAQPTIAVRVIDTKS